MGPRLIRWIVVASLLLLLPLGCAHETARNNLSSSSPHIRVRLVQDASRVSVGSVQGAFCSLDSRPGQTRVLFGRNNQSPLVLNGNTWQLGNVTLGFGTLTLGPAGPDPIHLNETAYHGTFHFIPTGPSKFDVVNDVEIDDYLKGVVSSEMYRNWHLAAFESQAVASRTYALYEARTGGMSRYWDVYPDERSQMYGGIDAETPQSRDAVDRTVGIVLTYGAGDGKIFRAYFSSCCGGVSQAAADAFPRESYIPPLSEQNRGSYCNASKYFNWGPITIPKDELTRRIRLWAARRSKAEGRAVPESSMANLYRIDVQSSNRYGRPSRVTITDSRGIQYSWSAEDLRTALNTDAKPGSTLPSSFCKINADPNSPSVTFFDGHGLGHGVGMCQYCAESLAASGHSAEQILLSSYPQAKLIRAY